MSPIYLDNNATTRISTEVVDAMRPYLDDRFANPSSVHAGGQVAGHAVDEAREAVADLVGAKPSEIAFTSGGTESDRLAIAGILTAHPGQRRIVTTAVEHAAVTDYCRLLETRGIAVTRIGVDGQGRLEKDEFADALGDDVAVASAMLANNETGVIFPIAELAEITRAKGCPLHVDAVQAAGRIAIDVWALGADLVSLSAHKMHGPKGIGALWIRPGIRWECPTTGARTPRERRSGTENVPAIVGFGAAARLVPGALDVMDRVAALRDRLESTLIANHANASIVGRDNERVANTTTICFEGMEAEAILIGLSERGVYVSSGSACSSGSIEPSHVLQAMGLPPARLRGAIRFSLSRYTTEAEIVRTIECVRDVVRRLTPAGS